MTVTSAKPSAHNPCKEIAHQGDVHLTNYQQQFIDQMNKMNKMFFNTPSLGKGQLHIIGGARASGKSNFIWGGDWGGDWLYKNPGRIPLDLKGLDDDNIRNCVIDGIADRLEYLKADGLDVIDILCTLENFLKHSGFLRRIKEVAILKTKDWFKVRFSLIESSHSLCIELGRRYIRGFFCASEGEIKLPVSEKHKYTVQRDDPLYHQQWKADCLFSLLSTMWSGKKNIEWKKNLPVRLKPWE